MIFFLIAALAVLALIAAVAAVVIAVLGLTSLVVTFGLGTMFLPVRTSLLFAPLVVMSGVFGVVVAILLQALSIPVISQAFHSIEAVVRLAAITGLAGIFSALFTAWLFIILARTKRPA